jgi:hypothetical protein
VHLVETLVPHLQPLHHLHLDLCELDALHLRGDPGRVRWQLCPQGLLESGPLLCPVPLLPEDTQKYGQLLASLLS